MSGAAEKVRVVEDAIAGTKANLAAALLRVEEAEGELEQLDEMRAGAVVGDLTGTQVEAFAAEHEGVRDEAATEIERLRGLLPALETKLVVARQQLLDDDLAAVGGDLAATSAAAAQLAGKELAGVLAAAAKQAVKLLEARARIVEVEGEYARAARLAGRDESPAGLLTDEPDWLPAGVERLLELVQSGPSTPVADLEARERRLQEQADDEQSRAWRKLRREVALETLQTPRLRDDETFDEVVGRVLDAHGLLHRRDDVVAEREQLIIEHLAEIEATYEHTEATWREQGLTPPERSLDEFELAWRRQNGVPVPDKYAPADAVEEGEHELRETGVVSL